MPGLTALRGLARRMLPRRTRFRVYWWMLDTPVLSDLYIRTRGRLRHRRIRPVTRLVIEGFPSSGNTFSRQAFLLGNPDTDPSSVCSHTHSPRVVMKAVRAGIPCIVLARDPRDAVSSMVQRFPGVPLDAACHYYQRYYSRLMPFAETVVVADFPSVISDFSSVIRRCNQEYGVGFATGGDGGISQDTVARDIEQRECAHHGGQVPSTLAALPSRTRKTSAEYLRGLDASEQAAMDDALATFRRFTASGAPKRRTSR